MNKIVVLIFLLLLTACSGDDDNGPIGDHTAPVIENFNDLTISADTVSEVMTITILDDVTPSEDLAVSVSSSDQRVIADNGLILARNGDNLELMIVPVSDTVGETVIHLIVSDAAGNTAEADVIARVVAREITEANLLDEVAMLSKDDEPVFINQIIISHEVDDDLGFDTFLD